MASKGAESPVKVQYAEQVDSDEERERKRDFFHAIRKGDLIEIRSLLEGGVKTDIIDKNNKDNSPLHYAVERGKKEVAEELLLPKWKANINAQNDEGNTPLHIAVSRNNEELLQLLLNYRAEVSIKNKDGETPLDIAHRLCGQNLVRVLSSHVRSDQRASDGEHSASHGQSGQIVRPKWSGNQGNDAQSSEGGRKTTPKIDGKKYMCQKKREGTRGGLDGHLYEIDLLILGKLRGERDTDEFYLDTNVSGLGAFDDVVFRYWNKKESKIILLQAKHAESSRRHKITIEKFRNPKSDEKFYLGKYFLSYLEIKEKFHDGSTDPVFKGNFKELDLECIIYTNSILDEQFDKDRITDIGTGIFSTKSNEDKDKAFKFSLEGENSDLIAVLENVSCQERVKLLAQALVRFIALDEPHYSRMMEDKSFSKYHVFLAKKVIDVRKEIKRTRKKEYREGKINQKFFNIDNKDRLEKMLMHEILYEYAKNVVFGRKSVLGLDDWSDLINKVTNSLKSSKTVDEVEIMKLAGSAIVLDTKKRKLKFANENTLNCENGKQFMKDLESKVGNLAQYEFDIPYESVETAFKEQTKEKLLKLNVSFGNISPRFKEPEHFINQLIKLFIEHKSQKVIEIDDIRGHGKLLIKNIGKLVGNLLVFDQEEKLLKLASEESLDEDALVFLNGLKTSARQEALEKVESYRFDIKVENFPRDSLFSDDEGEANVKEFLRKLKIFTGQASDTELQKIIKDEMRDFHKLTEEEVEDNFLKIKNKAEKVWKRGRYYLAKDDDFFKNILKFDIVFDVRDPVAQFVGREKDLDDLHWKIQRSSDMVTVISQAASITGLGGIGKSELARKYISKYSNSYNGNVIWIDAKNEQTLTESFHRLARNKLEISTKRKNRQEKNIKDVEDVYRFFTKRKSLFIFDDAEGYKNIKEFLPHSSNPDNRKPHILITSRNRDWKVGEDGEIKVISLDVFKPKEAEKFVEDFLEIKCNSHKIYIKDLTEQLQYFPLALRQAVAYIKQEDEELNKRGNGRFEISNYLKKFQHQKDILLNKGYYEDSDRYTKTVLTTWKTTLETIENNRKYGRQAIDILDIMAYFAPDKLIIKELFSMKQTDEEWNAVSLLDQYSMIHLKNGVVDIHNLVQEVTRQKVKGENKEKEVLRKALKGIDGRNVPEACMSHIISVWDYASDYPELVHEFCTRALYGRKKHTPVHLLARGGKNEGMDRILKILPDMIYIVNALGETPLFEAIKNSNNEGTAKRLIEVHHVDVTTDISACGHTPITAAAVSGKEGLLKFFVSKGADVNSRFRSLGLSALDFAAIDGNSSLVQYLIGEGAKVNNHSLFGGVLHQALGAARAGDACEDDVLKIIQLCLKKDPETIKIVNLNDETPLHIAVTLSLTNIVETLLSAGVDVNARTSFDDLNHGRGYTALHIASEENKKEFVMVLLKNQAHYDVKNADGKTPMDLATPGSDVKNLLICIDNLFKAVQDDDKDEVDSLLKERNCGELEAVLNARNRDGKTILEVATASKDENKTVARLIAKKLKNRGS